MFKLLYSGVKLENSAVAGGTRKENIIELAEGLVMVITLKKTHIES